MSEDDRFNDVVASLYEAAAGGLDWAGVSERVGDLIGASDVALIRPDADGKMYNAMALRERADVARAYQDHFIKVDPFRNTALRRRENAVMTVRFGQESVDEDQLLTGEYYNDFGRVNGYHHQIGAILDTERSVVFSAHRGAKEKSFEVLERDRLQALLPHVQRAVQLESRLSPKPTLIGAGFASLEALSTSFAIVDGNLHVVFVNAAGLASISESDCGLMIRRGTPSSSALQLMARNRTDNDRLQKLAASAASGGPGGAMRVRSAMHDTYETATTAVLIAPAPASMIDNTATPLRPSSGLAIIAVRDLHRAELRPSLLSALFDLSEAESAVGVALIGGATAEVVARQRKVSLDTVRTQIRAVLNKSNATNLREFERMAGSLSAIPIASKI